MQSSKKLYGRLMRTIQNWMCESYEAGDVDVTVVVNTLLKIVAVCHRQRDRRATDLQHEVALLEGRLKKGE